MNYFKWFTVEFCSLLKQLLLTIYFSLVIDCPSEDFLDDLLTKNEYEMYYNDNVVIVHFTPMDVMHDTRYLKIS